MDIRQEILSKIEIHKDEPIIPQGAMVSAHERPYPIVAKHEEFGIEIRLDTNQKYEAKIELATMLMEMAIDEIYKF